MGASAHTIPACRGKMLLLDHVGAKSGTERTSPLLYVRDGEDLVIVASKGGFPKHPAWFHNLRANPDTTVQVGSRAAAGAGPRRHTGGARAPLGAGRQRPATATRTTRSAATAARSRSSCSSRRPSRRAAAPAIGRGSSIGPASAALLGEQVAARVGDRVGRPGADPVVAGAVDRDRRAGEEVAGRRGEVGDQPGHLLRRGPARPIGIERSRLSTTSCGYLVSSVSVANWPAASAQVLIPKRAHSIASVRIMFSTAARAAPEWTIPGIPLWGERVTLSTLPPPCGMKALVAAAWVISQVPCDVQLDHGAEALSA